MGPALSSRVRPPDVEWYKDCQVIHAIRPLFQSPMYLCTWPLDAYSRRARDWSAPPPSPTVSSVSQRVSPHPWLGDQAGLQDQTPPQRATRKASGYRMGAGEIPTAGAGWRDEEKAQQGNGLLGTPNKPSVATARRSTTMVPSKWRLKAYRPAISVARNSSARLIFCGINSNVRAGQYIFESGWY